MSRETLSSAGPSGSQSKVSVTSECSVMGPPGHKAASIPSPDSAMAPFSDQCQVLSRAGKGLVCMKFENPQVPLASCTPAPHSYPRAGGGTPWRWHYRLGAHVCLSCHSGRRKLAHGSLQAPISPTSPHSSGFIQYLNLRPRP